MTRTTYQVEGIDDNGDTVVSREAFTLKAAKQEMRDMWTDPTYNGIARVVVTEDITGDVVIDQYA